MLDMSTLFFNDIKDECLLGNLDLSPTMEQNLNHAKHLIRQRLKDNLPAALAKSSGEDSVTQPRFFTQGSVSYKTVNSPAQHTQQADLDDGAYLPLSFVSEIIRPSHASKIYFEAVEKVLLPLAKEKGWKLIIDKDTCTRLEISNEAHIDIPLYAIPDHEFVSLTEARADSFIVKAALDSAKPDIWSALPSNTVLLAHRKEDWKASDPRPLKEWFRNQVKIKGEQLRRVVRYLKAYRDNQWLTGGPTSILLMAAAVPIFNKHNRRDDLALLEVVQQLPNILREKVNNPTDPTECLTNRFTKKEIEDAAVKFEELCKTLANCLESSNRNQACIWMREKFGSRFPNAPERMIVKEVISQTEDLSHVQQPPWPAIHAGRIEIRATLHASHNSPIMEAYYSDGHDLTPGTWLHFTATHSFTSNIHIKWQVVNTGSVARNARSLRGNISQTGQDIWEHTEYKGMHWVECFAVDLIRGVSLGRSGKFFVNIA